MESLDLLKSRYEDVAPLAKSTNISSFLNTYKSPLNIGGIPLVDYEPDSACGYLVANSMIFRINQLSAAEMRRTVRELPRTIPVGVLVDNNTTRLKNRVQVVLCNGDSLNNRLVGHADLQDHPTVSFACLSRLIFGKTDSKHQYQVGMMLAHGDLRLVDYCPDQYITIKKRGKKRRLPRGFTVVGGEAHRPATVLLEDIGANGASYLIGQDEGTYFGVELSNIPNTIETALTELMPPEARGTKGVLRQGEWFAIPVPKRRVPKITEAIAPFRDIDLPVTDAGSNRHSLYPCDEGLIAEDGNIFCFGGRMEHDEHWAVNLGSKWYLFKRNTAIRSVSEAGVD